MFRPEDEAGLGQKSQARDGRDGEMVGPEATFQCQPPFSSAPQLSGALFYPLFCICKNPCHSSSVPVEKWAKDRHRLFRDKEFQMSLKHMKGCSIMLIIIGMQIKSTQGIHQIGKDQTSVTTVWWGCGRLAL